MTNQIIVVDPLERHRHPQEPGQRGAGPHPRAPDAAGPAQRQPDRRGAGPAAVDGLVQHPDAGRRRAGADPGAEGAQGQPEDLPLDLRGAGDRFKDGGPRQATARIEVAMPLGLYTSCEVIGALRPLLAARASSGCSTCPTPSSIRTGCRPGCSGSRAASSNTSSPTMPSCQERQIAALEFSMELSSEVPGTSADWPSDITVAVNGKDIGTWTSPGDFGDKRGVYTPDWWKLKGSPVRQAEELAGDARRHLCRRHARSPTGHARRTSMLDTPPLDPAADRGQGRRQASRAASTSSAAASATTTRTSCCGCDARLTRHVRLTRAPGRRVYHTVQIRYEPEYADTDIGREER